MADAFVLDAVRTPMGKNGGQLSSVRGDQLLAECLRALEKRTKLDARQVEDVVGGCVTQTGEQGVNVIRQAVLAAGWPHEVPGVSLNRLCGSGQQAVWFAALEVMSGQADLAVGCGMESMSRTPMGSDVGSFNPTVTERHEIISQGLSAELVAERYGITRAEIDEFSFESHRKAVHAMKEGRFKNEIVPVPILDAEGNVTRTATDDEGPRPDANLEKMRTLKPVFKPDGVITAGSSSQITDGAAAVLIGTREKAKQLGLRPRARFVAHAQVGVDPTIMLTGPIPATRKVLEKAKLQLSDIDLVEINEAFSSVVLAWKKELSVDARKINVNGGAVALGHPLGCTGARLVTSLVNELERQKLRYGLVTMCIGFGQGTATIIERVS
ncbi:thiolase family protein [bacterium]|nr:thiolase family protein [bacterium]